ncbi:MAG: hypothetical protein HZB13_07545 [Acidobacteria bacterium]|nr:hypothetical protein [Acidobacteriota bacterium]
MNGGDVAAVIMVAGTFAVAVVAIMRTLFDHIRRTKSEQLQSELYNKMLDKLGSGPEVLGWLQTGSVQNLFKATPAERPAPYSRILNAVQFGVVATVAGLGILGIWTQLDYRSKLPAMVIGMLVLSLGLGMLMAGAASWMLSRKLGLINGKTQPGE